MFGWGKKMAQQPNTETEMSMEEILDSIRKYVAEESSETAADPARLPHKDSIVVPPRIMEGPHDDILELTEQFEAPPQSPQQRPAAAQANLHSARDAAGYAMSPAIDPTTYQRSAQQNMETRQNVGARQQPSLNAEQYASRSQPTRQTQQEFNGSRSIAQDFSRLSTELQNHEPNTSSGAGENGQNRMNNPSGKTLDQLVNELARPMIQEWLNTNLPEITSRLINNEIERMRKTGTR